MTLYEKLVEAYKDRARSQPMAQNMVLNVNNRVPEMLAEIAIKVVYEHQIDEERKELNDVVTGA